MTIDMKKEQESIIRNKSLSKKINGSRSNGK